MLGLLFLLAGCERRSQAPVTLPDYGRLSSFTLSDEAGKRFDSQSLNGRVWVLDFIFTRCRAACPRMSTEMQKVQAAAPQAVELVSITVDPEHDSPEVLREYARRYRAQSGRWHFLTGSKDVILELQRQASVDMNPEDLGQPHSKCFVLIDGEGFIRGVYRSTRPEETEQLLLDIRTLRQNPGRPEPGTPGSPPVTG